MQQFYNKQSIFMTGATGFLGKVLIEKLLRTCNVECIYMLIRNKKEDDIHTRLTKIFDDPLFDLVKNAQPKFRHKIVAISGDCMLPGLGIDAHDRALLVKHVNIVFHVAATVRFDEKLKLALAINVCGTREILTLSREIENLKSLVHVSTAYANCNQPTAIDEKFYNISLTGENALKLAECLDDKTLDTITPQILQDWPNTYTFTKFLAEDLVKSQGKGLPVAIFRPAIVIPTYLEPIQGWIDNMYGPTGIIIGVAAGLLRILLIHKENNAEIVPVDLCVNSLIATAYDIGINTYEEPPIYNYVTSSKNRITWETYTKYGIEHGLKVPLLKNAWYYSFKMSSSRFLVTILTFLYHTIPAAIVDFGLFVTGKKPKLLDTYKKIDKLCDVLSYFTNRVWQFSNDNVRSLWERMDEKDKEIFYFDMDQVDWSEFIQQSMFGIRTYLMKEDPKTIPAAIKRMNKLKVIHYVTVYTLRAIGLFILYKILASIFSIFMDL
ncbi:unnamed protein product [Diamesa hyperborea]